MANDLIKYITTRVVDYMETPRQTRIDARRSRRERWSMRWFGMLPWSLRIWGGQKAIVWRRLKLTRWTRRSKSKSAHSQLNDESST